MLPFRDIIRELLMAQDSHYMFALSAKHVDYIEVLYIAFIE